MPKGKGKPRPEIIPPAPLRSPVPDLYMQVDKQLPGSVAWVRYGLKRLIDEAYQRGQTAGAVHALANEIYNG